MLADGRRALPQRGRRDAGKTSPLPLPAEWELSGGYAFPAALYVEAIDPSAAVRDVHLRLRYTAAGGQYVDDNIRLTVFNVEIDSIDAHFAPSVERLAVRSTIKPLVVCKTKNAGFF